jgi:uncharacterized protein YjiS (DUF1127 family)
MGASITLPDVIASTGSTPRTVTAPGVAAGRALFARCGDWLRQRNDAARLREMEPHLAQDIGLAPGCDGRPEGFAADPRPLWGIGLTPQPFDATPPRSPRRSG